MRCARFTLMSVLALGCGTSSSRDAGVTDARANVPGDDGYPSVCGMTQGDCNWVANTGCDAGAGCYRAVVDGGVRQLCAAVGSRGWGVACTRANECAPGLGCLGEPGRCTPLCCGGDHARCEDPTRGGRPGGLCVGAVVGTDARYCLETGPCSPVALSGNGCPSDRPRCDVVAASGATACGAVVRSPGGDGTPCCRSESCGPGFACIRDITLRCDEASPAGLCRRLCATGADAAATCPAGQSCSLRFDGLPDTLGACAPTR